MAHSKEICTSSMVLAKRVLIILADRTGSATNDPSATTKWAIVDILPLSISLWYRLVNLFIQDREMWMRKRKRCHCSKAMQ